MLCRESVFFLAEGEQHVAKEVPKGGDGDGQEFEEVEPGDGLAAEVEEYLFVEVGPQGFAEQEYAVVDEEAHDAYADELEVFHTHLFLMAAEGPYAVEEVVAGGGAGEANGVG